MVWIDNLMMFIARIMFNSSPGHECVTVTNSHRKGCKKREFQSILKLANPTKKGTLNDRQRCPNQ
ncbi:MAG: hypothetical protein AAGU75_16655, partial [Bacillota bacterium]